MIKSIHFGGGAFAVIGYIGVLNYLEKVNVMEKSMTLSGTSAGAIFAFLMTIGLKSQDMLQIFTPDVLKTMIQLRKLTDFEKDGNLLNYSELWKKLHGVCAQQAYNFDTLTFQELYNVSNITLIITGTCIQQSECELFSHILHPDMNIMKALEITTCIPLLLKPIQYKDKFYVDGAISDNCMFQKCDIIVGNNIDFNRNFLQNTHFDIIDYISNIVVALMSIVTNIRYKTDNCILITSESFLPYFNSSSMLKMILDGYEKTELYFKKHT